MLLQGRQHKKALKSDAKPQIAIVRACGPIVGVGERVPLLGPEVEEVASEHLYSVLRQAGRDPSIKGIILQIDSPGLLRRKEKGIT